MNTAYYRESNLIKSVEKNADGGPKEVLKFDSTNKAKKESRKMQLAHGGLGGGYVQLVKEEVEQVKEDNPVIEEAIQKPILEYFPSRSKARSSNYVIMFGGKVIDKGINSEKGKRWAVVAREV